MSAASPSDWEPSLPGASAAWLHGAAEALSVLSRRGPAERQRAAQQAVELLVGQAEPASWERIGSAGTVPPDDPDEGRVRRDDPAVLHLVRVAVSLRCSTLRRDEQVQAWRLAASLFSEIAGPGEPMLHRVRGIVLCQLAEAGDVSAAVVDGLLSNYRWHLDTYGRSAYLTSLARTNLGVAYRQRSAPGDLSMAEALFREEIDTRTGRYGGGHPFVLVARNLLAGCLLEQAERAADPQDRRTLALKAYDEAGQVRVARDALFGVTAANSTLSRRHQGHALMLVGDPDALRRALACLHYVLAFETQRNGNREWRGSGETHLLLARVYVMLKDTSAALEHAANAQRLLCADEPGGSLCRKAVALVQEISGSVSPEPGI